MFAGVPCYNLKALHSATADNMPVSRTQFGAWKEMQETWKHQKIDPNYANDKQVPSEGVPTHRRFSVAASIGELGPADLRL